MAAQSHRWVSGIAGIQTHAGRHCLPAFSSPAPCLSVQGLYVRSQPAHLMSVIVWGEISAHMGSSCANLLNRGARPSAFTWGTLPWGAFTAGIGLDATSTEARTQGLGVRWHHHWSVFLNWKTRCWCRRGGWLGALSLLLRSLAPLRVPVTSAEMTLNGP